jgi:hypothetical protein
MNDVHIFIIVFYIIGMIVSILSIKIENLSIYPTEYRQQALSKLKILWVTSWFGIVFVLMMRDR